MSLYESDLLFVVLHPLSAHTKARRRTALHVNVVRPAVAGLVTAETPGLLHLRHLQQNIFLSLSLLG